MPSSHRTQHHLGAKLGPRVARLTADAMTHHLHKSAGVRAKIAAAGGVAFMDTITKEMQAHGGGLIARIADHELTPDELRPMLRFMAHGSGEGSALMNFAVYGSGVSTPIAASIANFLAPVQQDLIRHSPNGLVPPAGAADAVARGIVGLDAGTLEAAMGGLNSVRFLEMVEAAYVLPDISQLVDLRNRGLISQQRFNDGLQRAGIQPDWWPLLADLREVLLSPSDLALMALRGIITTDQGAAVAAKSGVPAADFELLVEATGEPPGLEQMLEGYRRGFIDESRLQRGIRQSRVRDEWQDLIEKLRFEPADTSDALRGVIQGHLSDADGKQIAQWNGLRPEDWDWLVKTEGNPLATGQMLELLNRGEVTEDQVRIAIKEGRTKDKYIDAALKLRRKLPADRVIITAVAHGAMSKEHALALLVAQGYDQADANALLATGAAQKTNHARTLAEGDVLALYAGHAIDNAKAHELLKSLGYDEQEASWLLELAELKRERAYVDAGVSAIGGLYAHWKADENRTGTYLDALGVSHEQKEHLMETWGLEREANRPHLTMAELIKANKNGALTNDQVVARLAGQGWSEADVVILIAGE